MNKVIVFADARSRISLSENSTLARHSEYIGALQKIQGFEEATLLIMQPALSTFKSQTIELENITIVRLPLSRLLKARKYFASNGLHVLLMVAGDPWESYIFSLILNVLIGGKAPTQVQIHSELSKAWSSQSLFNRLRTNFAGFALRKANNVRTVSIEQRDYIVDKYRLDKNKTDVVPVQFNNAKVLAEKESKVRPLTVGFIGRVHKERNIERFVEITSYLMSKDKNLRLVIATIGEMDSQEGSYFSRIPADRMTKFENLAPEELHIFWEKVGVLLSTSQSESFGRSIREAIVNGVPVLAQNSMGARELKKECNESVELFDNKDSLDSLFKTYNSLLQKEVPKEHKELLKSKNERIPIDIAKSWQKTADIFHIR